MEPVETDVAILGGGFGGVSAALALLNQGRSVVMVERHPWIGGQVTSQALCVLDDYHDPSGETTGISRSYAEFRRRVRDAYKARHPLAALGAAQIYLNPGNALCSHLSAEPQIAHAVLVQWLQENAKTPAACRIYTGHHIAGMKRDHDRVTSCRIEPLNGDPADGFDIRAGFFLDATETGETYPLLSLPFRTGSEARATFNEPHAPETAQPDSIQSFTFCVGAEFVPEGRFTISKPPQYEAIRDRQGFALFAPGCDVALPAMLWTAQAPPDGPYISGAWFYRSVRDPRNFAEPGLTARTIINVPGNDYHDAPYLGRPDDEAALEEARALSRAYVYWLQTEAPRDEGGYGYPEIRPCPEMTGTPDGIAMAPYIREGRRLEACTTISERDVHADFWPGSRSRHHPDSVGLGAYQIDLHRTTGGSPGLWEPAKPYQIPLGALVSPELKNFAVANKGIGVTQIANGAYRLHPVEWAIGEAAGMLADYSLNHPARHPRLQGEALRTYQRALVRRGVPLYWYDDVPYDLPGFEAIQMLAVEAIWPGTPDHLRCDPYDSLDRNRTAFLTALKAQPPAFDPSLLRSVFLTAHNARKHDVMHTLDQLRS